MKNVRIFFILFLIGHCCHVFAEQYCYADDNDPFIQFSTKTAYELIRAKKTYPVPYCKPVMIWASLRHGTRYPGRSEIKKMKSLPEFRDQIIHNYDNEKTGELCSKDIQNLRNWTYVLSENYSNKLSTQGKDDLRFLAKRMKSQFSAVLDTPYSEDKFLFYNDGVERTVDSTVAFVDGLFGPDIPNVYENSTLIGDLETCDTWVKQVDEDPEANKEYELFTKSSHVQNVIQEVSRRLGFRSNLSLSDVTLMYDMCRFEKAWYIASRPPFCAVFSKDNLKVLEYLQDIKYYYKYSYGNDIAKKIACPLTADLMKRFNDVAENNNKAGPKATGVFYFSHTNMNLPLLTLLKIKEDSQHLLHNNYEFMSRREFMTSLINPFSANLVVAFYKCSVGEENRVMFYLNEDIVRYPGCDAGLCSWYSIYEKFKSTVEPGTCNFDFCSGSSGHVNAPFKWALVFISLYSVIQLSN